MTKEKEKKQKVYEPFSFRYFGNKRKYCKIYRKPEKYNRVVELFLGSGAFSINENKPAIGFELSERVCSIWKFLQSTNVEELTKIGEYWTNNRKEMNKKTVNDLPYTNEGLINYFRTNVCGVYNGNPGVNSLYAQHALPVHNTIAALNRIQDITVVNKDFTEYVPLEGDLVFIDPPYLNTRAAYKNKSEIDSCVTFSPSKLSDFVSTIKNPMIFTYGNNAEKDYPMYKWEKLDERFTPKIKGGGKSLRTEYVSYINF